jgi:hypothetical protein
MRESYIETKVTQYARGKGLFTTKFLSSNYRGLPDRIYIYSGYHFFIEFKAPGEKATKLQDHIHDVMRGHGANIFIIDNIDNGLQLIDKIIKENDK